MAYRKSSDGPFGLLPKKTAPDVLGAPQTAASSGTPMILEYIDTRAERGSREKFEAVFNKVPSTEPELDDWLDD
jgi:hypothetical protein